MNDPIAKRMHAKAIGDMVIMYLESVNYPIDCEGINTRALDLISRIKDILNDEELSDPDCFMHIEAIVDAFYDEGISTNRHDWG